MLIVHIHCIVFELCMRKRRKNEEERRRKTREEEKRKKENKIKIFRFDFLDSEKN